MDEKQGDINNLYLTVCVTERKVGCKKKADEEEEDWF